MARAVAPVPVVLLGPGRVGTALLSQVIAARALHAQRGLPRLAVVAVADRSGVLAPRGDELSDADLEAVIADKRAGRSLSHSCDGTAAQWARHLDPERAERLGAAPVIVDTTAADTTASLLDARRRGWRLVLANKIPLTGTMDAFERITAGGRGARWETTVASALPVIATLQTLVDRADGVRWITGTLSGSLGFVAARLEAGEALSSAVAEAQARGLTEPDPRADLSGLDVARKALILARMLGRPLGLPDVRVERLYPREWDALDVEAFRARLPGCDERIARRVAQLRSAASAVRYVATVGPDHVRASLVGLSREARMAGGDATDSVVVFESEHFGANPLVLSGRGAGPASAAAGVLGDLVSVARA